MLPRLVSRVSLPLKVNRIIFNQLLGEEDPTHSYSGKPLPLPGWFHLGSKFRYGVTSHYPKKTDVIPKARTKTYKSS